ncbi:MAG: 50S ribosomal protein L32 [Gemmatimonadota bacterium]
MAVPKRRTSKQRKRKRRGGQVIAKSPPTQSCGRCGDPHRPHHVCPSCGYYGEREVLRVEEF